MKNQTTYATKVFSALSTLLNHINKDPYLRHIKKDYNHETDTPKWDLHKKIKAPFLLSVMALHMIDFLKEQKKKKKHYKFSFFSKK